MLRLLNKPKYIWNQSLSLQSLIIGRFLEMDTHRHVVVMSANLLKLVPTMPLLRLINRL